MEARLEHVWKRAPDNETRLITIAPKLLTVNPRFLQSAQLPHNNSLPTELRVRVLLCTYVSTQPQPRPEVTYHRPCGSPGCWHPTC